MEFNPKQIQILEIAEKLFANQSFDGTTVRQIAEEAKINVAMISYYFGSKEKLLTSLLAYRNSDFEMELKSAIAKNHSFLEIVDTFIAITIQRVHKSRRTYKIIHFEFSNGNRLINFEDFLNRKRENYKKIETFVKKGQEAKIFSKNVNTQLVIPTILGIYFHFYYNQTFFKHLHQLESKKSMDDYVTGPLTLHIQRTIKAMLTYED